MCANVAVRRCLGLLFLAICTTVGSFAQLGKGTISGTITDPQGAAVGGASVIIINTSTNAEFKTTTGDSGFYTAPGLAIGSYRVSAEAPGFKRGLRNGLNLQVDEHAEVDFKLEVGAVSDSVEVQAEATLVETGSATVGKVIENRRIEGLPPMGVTHSGMARANAEREIGRRCHQQRMGGRFRWRARLGAIRDQYQRRRERVQ